tara:strand:+ start:74 stop:661 length:588 start_codon:yes stop_codon:yes gene_type:complete
MPVAIILLGGGFLACFLGYRLFRFILLGYGLVTGVVLVSQLNLNFPETWMVITATIIGGLIGAALFLAVYFVGVAVAGAGLGVLAVHLVWTQRSDDPHLLVIILMAIVGVFLAMVFQRYVIILVTSFTGALLSLVAVIALLGHVNITEAEVRTLEVLKRISEERAVLFAWLVLSLLGVFVQLRKTSAGKHKKQKK